MPGHRIVGWLMPHGRVRHRSPDLPLTAGGISRRTQPSRNRREDSDTVGDELEDSAHVRIDVAVEHGSLITAVAPYGFAVPPPTTTVSRPIEPSNRRNVTMSGGAAG